MQMVNDKLVASHQNILKTYSQGEFSFGTFILMIFNSDLESSQYMKFHFNNQPSSDVFIVKNRSLASPIGHQQLKVVTT